ncbi:hypothetical protein ACHAWF_017158 [Thalassiosira exigua]
MTRHDILSLRCIAMDKGWKIPKSYEEFKDFLCVSRSSICAKGRERHATHLDVSSPFELEHRSPLHALAILVGEKFGFLAPGIDVGFSTGALRYDFGHQISSLAQFPSAMTLSEVSFHLDYFNVLIDPSKQREGSVLRPLLRLSFESCGLGWDVVDANDVRETVLPAFPDESLAGIIYKKRCASSTTKVLCVDMGIAVAPTKSKDLTISLDLKSSHLDILVNPYPMLTALQALVDFSDIPFRPPDQEANPDVLTSNDPPAIVNTMIHARFERSSILLMTDCKQIECGILDFEIDNVAVKLRSSGMSGDLQLSMPVAFRAARIIDSPSLDHPGIECKKMPFKPIIKAEQVRLMAKFKESEGASTESSTFLCSVEVATDEFQLNASPSTLEAVIGFLPSLDPFLDWGRGEAEEEERARLEKETAKLDEDKANLSYRRRALRKIFNSVDLNESGTLQEEEVDQIVLMLFADRNDASRIVNGAQRLTAAELKRERDHLLFIVDSGHTNQVSYQEVDSILFRMAEGINDNNLTPKIGVTGVEHLDRFSNSREFLSAPMMRNLVYFGDLQEYAAMQEVYRITGFAELHNGFPASSLWHQGRGIDLFWDLYTSDTGCTQQSLNGQDIYSIQCKLVRSLKNFEFAKFCWKTLVQPQWHASYNGREEQSNSALTCWLLDNNSEAKMNASVIDRLFKQIDQLARVSKESRQQGKQMNIRCKLVLSVNRAVLLFGSSHTFTNPLLEAEFSQVSFNGSALVSSETGWLVPEIKGDGRGTNHAIRSVSNDVESSGCSGQWETGEGNEVRFSSTLTLKYLNTKHDHMECFIEPYPCFGHLTYKTFLQDGIFSQSYGDDLETSSFTVNVNCPRSLSINALPAFFETVSMLAKFAAKCKDKFEKLYTDNSDQKDGLRRVSCNLVDDEHEVVSVGNPQKDPKSNVCYFAGCHELSLNNCIGRMFTFRSNASEAYQSVDANENAVVTLDSIQSQPKMSLDIERYKTFTGGIVSPYQSIMLPLTQSRSQKKQHKKKKSSASGFSPFLSVVPTPDSLDSITLTIRPCLTIHTQIAIRVTIVRLPKSLGYLKKKGTKSQIDLTKKNLLAALNRLVTGARIVYEKDDVSKGVEVPLPLNIMDSSYYHALLVQDATGWRDPVLLSKDFLFNPMNIREVGRSHALSGIVVQRERLNVCSPKKHHSDATKNKIRRTAWDTTILVLPFFLLTNSMPFPILARTWQLSPKGKEDDDIWQDPAILTNQSQADEGNEESISSDEDLSSATPSIRGRGNPDQFHLPLRSKGKVHYSLKIIQRGEMLRYSGINLRQTLFMQISQNLVTAPGQADFTWSKPIEIKLSKLRTGINPKGLFSLPKISLELGVNCDCLLDVSVEGETRVPMCSLYSPFWLMNKTGAKLEYKSSLKLESGRPKRYLDSGYGGLPIMLHCDKHDKVLSVIPLESPNHDVASSWWDTSKNGELVMKTGTIKGKRGHHLVDWSEKIALDTAGTNGEITCNKFLFGVSIESLAGAFYRSNLITIAPRFTVKNTLHIPITVLAIAGSKDDALRKASQLRHLATERDRGATLNLGKRQSTIIYNFLDISFAKGVEKSYRWVTFCVNSERFGDFKPKWHLIPLDEMGSTYFGEHDGFNDTMCGIVEAKVHGKDEARVVSITHAVVPPFRIENRSNDHHLKLVQAAADADVFELPPMHSVGFTWDTPLGQKKLRAVVVSKTQSEGNVFDSKNAQGDASSEDTTGSHISDQPLNEGSTSFRSFKSKGSSSFSRRTSKAGRTSNKQRSFGLKSRCYDMAQVGSKKGLPCPVSDSVSSTLWVHLRISAGTKILSFNDSPWLTNQVESGLLRKGGDFKSATCSVSVDGLSLVVCDNFPRELIGVVVKDVQIRKPMGSIEATATVRHFQVDAMLPNARYPIIIQPKLHGVDRQARVQNNALAATRTNVDEKDCYWLKRKEESSILEVQFSYVPQSNMTWIPSGMVFICPMKFQLDVDYILRVVGLVVNSLNKHQGEVGADRVTTTHANDPLQYITYGQNNSGLTYIERLYITPLYFEVEINIKPDDLELSETDAAGEATLTLNKIAQSTNSATAAGILGWVVNVGANFAHVSPTFTYAAITYTDRYCDALELARDIVIYYIVQSIKQSYKTIFSMQILGDPSLLLHQYRTGISDLVFRTRDELVSGGSEGFGQGVISFTEHVVGGSFFAIGKISGGLAKTLDSLITNDSSSNHLKPRLATDRRQRPHHAVEGFTRGSLFLGKTVIHGTAGLLGNPYRGAKHATSVTGTLTGFTKGMITGVVGLLASPVIGTLGFVALTSDGIGATARYFELGAAEARCRPARSVPWGAPMIASGLSYMKAIGVRVHTVRYQNIRKCIAKKEVHGNENEDDESPLRASSSKEYKRLRGVF